MIRAVAYYRKSNDDAGESITQQQSWVSEVVAREGVAIVKDFSDQSVSGWDTARRSGFAQMLAFCQEQARLGNPIEAVVCYHANRFSRSDSLETSRFLCEFRDAGVTRMLTASRWINFNSPEDRMLFGLEQEVSSHRYSTDLSRVTTRGKRAAAAKGLWNGGKPPFGYTVQARKLIPHETEADQLKWLFVTYATTDISIRGLVDQLRDRDVRSPTGKGLWLPATVAKVLRNPLYLGDAIFGRADYSPFAGAVTVQANTRKPSSGRPRPESGWVRVPDAHPALIDRQTFDRVQNRLAANRVRKSPRKVAPFALSGLLVCGGCGRRMIAQTSHVKANGKLHKYRLYTCANYHVNGVASGCGRNTVEEGRMVSAVMKKLAQRFTAPEAVAALRAEIARQDEAESQPDTKAADLEKRLTEIGRRIGKLVERLEDDLPEDVMSDVRDRLRKLSEERSTVQAELASVRAAAVATEPGEDRIDRLMGWVTRLQEAVQQANPGVVSELLRGLLDRVEVFFTNTKQGKRTRAEFAKAFLYLNGQAWAESPSLSTASALRPSRTPAAWPPWCGRPPRR